MEATTSPTPATTTLAEGFTLTGKLVSEFKAENGPQSPAGLFRTGPGRFGPPNFRLLSGSPPSYNNWTDVDRLLTTTGHIAAAYSRVMIDPTPHIAVCVKHGNASGAGIGDSRKALERMMAGDKLASFGGLVMINFDFTEEYAAILAEQKFDGILAPNISEEAITRLERKHGKCRFQVNEALYQLGMDSLDHNQRHRYVRDGVLVQSNYTSILNLSSPDVVRYGEASPDQENDMRLAWAICATSNSNTITLVKDRMLVGNGVGQQARVYAAELAVERAVRAGHDIDGAVAVSDSFFVNNDAVEALINAGVTAIFATSGSELNDKKLIPYCQEKGVVLYTIPDSKGRMFFGH